MIPEESSSAPPAQPRRPFQFSLFALFALMTTAALGSAVYANWNLVGGVLIFLVSLVGVLVLFTAIRLAIHLAIGQRADR
jgi:hypothetical protein